MTLDNNSDDSFDLRFRASVASEECKKLDINVGVKVLRGAAITAIKNRYRNAWKKFEDTANHVAALEDRLLIQQRWKPSDSAYHEAAMELTMRKYRIALDRLERLVVQRLLELSKLSMGNVGMVNIY